MAAPNILEQIKTFFTRYTLQQKLMLAGSAALVMVMMWLLVFFMNRVEYQTLYADLDPQEAQGIVQKVQELKVPYQLSEDGRTIKVASDKLSEIRIQLASQGLPESGRVGFEIFGRTNFGLTNFQEQVNYQRALESVAQFDVVLCEKLHVGVVAACRGVPFVALKYRSKVLDFCRSIGWEDFCVGLEDLTPDRLSAHVNSLIGTRDQHSTRLQKSVLETRARLVAAVRPTEAALAAGAK